MTPRRPFVSRLFRSRRSIENRLSRTSLVRVLACALAGALALAAATSLVVTAVVPLFGPVPAAHADPAAGSPSDAERRAAGYDHLSHESKVSVAGKPEVPCVRCHRVTPAGLLSGRPDHASCFGDCHGARPRPRKPRRPMASPGERLAVCVVCHAPAAIERAVAGKGGRLTVSFPPYATDRDHGLILSHRVHAVHTRDKGDCAACHRAPSPSSRQAGKQARRTPPGRARNSRPHARCASCHRSPVKAPAESPAKSPAPSRGGDMPAMTDCARCHPLEIGPRSRPFLVRGKYPVQSTFSHSRHQARGARGCLVCHEAIAETDGNQLPTPSMATCDRCHDGKRAFSTVATRCRRCHVQRASGSGSRPSPGRRFRHGQHSEYLAKAPCTTCHRLDRSGRPLPPAPDHAPCSDAGCHREDFSSPQPTICGSCHVGIEPWRELHFDAKGLTDTEFGARFSHKSHLHKSQSAECDEGAPCSMSCDGCHRAEAEMSLTRDHRSCTGDGCHGSGSRKASTSRAKPWAAPQLDRCDGCHEAGLVANRRAQRLSGEWSVRARFRHQPHSTDPRTGKALPCATCHLAVQGADDMASIPAPTKATCLPCHNGAIAFKVTGHGCTRCHTPSGK